MTKRRDFIKAAALGSAVMSFPSILMQSCKTAATASSNGSAPYFMTASPESQGISSSAILNFIEAANKCDYEWHGFSLIRHGKKIAEAYWAPFEKGGKHTLYSLSKSFTSTAIGLLVDAGKLKVTDSVISFFPESLPTDVSANLKAMTVHHLLSMNTGNETEPAFRGDATKTWVQNWLAHPVPHAPGSHFLYNTGATYMLGAIVHKITGETLVQFLKPRLFDPLGITDYDWEESPQGLNTAGYGLRVSTESIARFGQLYLQKGNWKGKQLISESWVEEATKKQGPSQDNDSDWGQGYGYQFWRCKPGFYRGDGAYGQYCIVMPQYDAVLAINSESWDMGKSMQIAWDTLLPAFKENALTENPQALAALNQKMTTLQIPTKKSTPTIAAKHQGQSHSFTLENNDLDIQKVGLAFTDKNCSLTLTKAGVAMTSVFAYDGWAKNPAKNYGLLPKDSNQINIPFAGSAHWESDDQLRLVAKFTEGIHSDKLRLDLAGGKLRLEMMGSVVESRKGVDGRKALMGVMG